MEFFLKNNFFFMKSFLWETQIMITKIFDEKNLRLKMFLYKIKFNCDKTKKNQVMTMVLKLKLYHNSKTQIMTESKTQIVAKPKN